MAIVYSHHQIKILQKSSRCPTSLASTTRHHHHPSEGDPPRPNNSFLAAPADRRNRALLQIETERHRDILHPGFWVSDSVYSQLQGRNDASIYVFDNHEENYGGLSFEVFCLAKDIVLFEWNVIMVKRMHRELGTVLIGGGNGLDGDSETD